VNTKIHTYIPKFYIPKDIQHGVILNFIFLKRTVFVGSSTEPTDQILIAEQ